jgi:hypothetical protein
MYLIVDEHCYQHMTGEDNCCVSEKILIQANNIVESWIYNYCYKCVAIEIKEAICMLYQDMMEYNDDSDLQSFARQRAWNFLNNKGMLNRNACVTNVNSCCDCCGGCCG